MFGFSPPPDMNHDHVPDLSLFQGETAAGVSGVLGTE
jgi:hypothetical protein